MWASPCHRQLNFPKGDIADSGSENSTPAILFYVYSFVETNVISHIFPTRIKHAQPRERGVARVVPTDELSVKPFAKLHFDLDEGIHQRMDAANARVLAPPVLSNVIQTL